DVCSSDLFRSVPSFPPFVREGTAETSHPYLPGYFCGSVHSSPPKRPSCLEGKLLWQPSHGKSRYHIPFRPPPLREARPDDPFQRRHRSSFHQRTACW